VFRFHPSRFGILAVALSAALLCASAHALERVHLSNGFSYDCTSTEPVDAEHIRLYLYSLDTADQSKNFTVIASKLILSVEPLPDPPPPVLPTQTITAATVVASVPELLAKAGAQHNIDVELLASVVKAESNGRTDAVSRTGARGLMQLMPGTAQTLGVDDAFRPDQNIAGGSAYLDALLTRYHDRLDLALAAYNAGPGAVDHYHGVPPFRETRAYVNRVETEFKRRKQAALKLLTQHSSNETMLASR
jgi:soluble lytic murein transglycosylase-like protein